MTAALPLTMWNATRSLAGRPSVSVPEWVMAALAYLFSAILPVFYFAMWRNPGEVAVSTRARLFCLVGVLCGVIVMRDQMPPPTVTTALSLLATLCCVVLLIAMYLLPGATGHRSPFLQVMTRVALIGGLLWFGINVLTFALNPNPGSLGTLFEQICLFTAPFLVAASR